MSSFGDAIAVSLPYWWVEETSKIPEFVPSIDAQMSLVNQFARLNMEHNTGGPFAAAVFERDSGRFVTMGLNRVVECACSSAHAEVVALSHAQKILKTYDLGAQSLPAHQLVVNWLPCAMCFGAVVWSGVRHLVIAGSGPELEDITGFDEGPRHPDWRKELERRKISVDEGRGREEAICVFRDFAKSRRLVYNGRNGDNVSKSYQSY